MASVFTYNTEVTRVSSPWSNGAAFTFPSQSIGDREYTLGGLPAPAPFLLEGSGITKLDAEPQDGPTEYKLHLLLRQRKGHAEIPFPATIGSLKQIRGLLPQDDAGGKVIPNSITSTPPSKARQDRLEHLTTQLLWRLQQSSPYHAQSTLKIIPPALPEAGPRLTAPTHPGKLVSGLEESKGALYEIGVNDSGVFVGLTKDEMDESLVNLRSMAACLGCRVEILRTVIVGKCKTPALTDDADLSVEKLWVVEALVSPDISNHSSRNHLQSPLESTKFSAGVVDSQTDQLRVSLAGAGSSGKSSLVGTLTTSALDNGRGKTRLSLLKHRHEIESGITSSVAPELIGYHTNPDGEVRVVNYKFENTSSWNDIHIAAEGERLVFLLDSAGHPRYRRTTIRSVISWVPHWTLCCIAADDAARTASGAVEFSDAAKAHLDLCLELDLPLVLVITKFDVGDRTALKEALASILNRLKAVGRIPVILKPDTVLKTSDELQELVNSEITEVDGVFKQQDSSRIVPIIFTSVVKGWGLSKLHALLRRLPLQELSRGTNDDTGITSFHIDEIFVKQNAGTSEAFQGSVNIVSGHLCNGNLAIGDQILIGPFTSATPEDRPVELSRARSFPSQAPLGVLNNIGLSVPKVSAVQSLRLEAPMQRSISEHFSLSSHQTSVSDSVKDEWLPARITSIRNLRLPLRKLLAGQIGTIGIDFLTAHNDLNDQKLRKGMVLLRQVPQTLPPRACSAIKVRIPYTDYWYKMMEPGSLFTLYVASIRASVKILSIEVPAIVNDIAEDEEDVFRLDTQGDTLQEVAYTDDGRPTVHDQPPQSSEIDVTLAFVNGREWVELGSKVHIMSNSLIEGGSGLDGPVGIVAEVL